MPPPTFPTSISVVDNQNGTVNISVSGATPDSLVLIYYAPFTPIPPGNGPWVYFAQIPTNGAGAGAIANAVVADGFWLWMAFDEAACPAVCSPALYRPTRTAGAVSVWEQCVISLFTYVNALALPGLSGRVNYQWFPEIKKGMAIEPPCCLIAPFGAEEYVGGMNNTDDVLYPVILVLIDNVNKESRGNMSRDLLWRQIISRSFRFQRLPAVANVIDSTLSPEVVVHPEIWDSSGLIVSGLLFKFKAREPRGFGG